MGLSVKGRLGFGDKRFSTKREAFWLQEDCGGGGRSWVAVVQRDKKWGGRHTLHIHQGPPGDWRVTQLDMRSLESDKRGFESHLEPCPGRDLSFLIRQMGKSLPGEPPQPACVVPLHPSLCPCWFTIACRSGFLRTPQIRGPFPNHGSCMQLAALVGMYL